MPKLRLGIGESKHFSLHHQAKFVSAGGAAISVVCRFPSVSFACQKVSKIHTWEIGSKHWRGFIYGEFD